jgi:hypothetical protein
MRLDQAESAWLGRKLGRKFVSQQTTGRGTAVLAQPSGGNETLNREPGRYEPAAGTAVGSVTFGRFGGVDEVSELAHGDRQPREVGRPRGVDLPDHLQAAADRGFVVREPRLDALARQATRSAEHLGGERGPLGIDVVSQRRPRHRIPVRIARQCDDLVAQPVELEALAECEVDLCGRRNIEPGSTRELDDVQCWNQRLHSR